MAWICALHSTIPLSIACKANSHTSSLSCFQDLRLNIQGELTGTCRHHCASPRSAWVGHGSPRPAGDRTHAIALFRSWKWHSIWLLWRQVIPNKHIQESSTAHFSRMLVQLSSLRPQYRRQRAPKRGPISCSAVMIPFRLPTSTWGAGRWTFFHLSPQHTLYFCLWQNEVCEGNGRK